MRTNAPHLVPYLLVMCSLCYALCVPALLLICACCAPVLLLLGSLLTPSLICTPLLHCALCAPYVILHCSLLAPSSLLICSFGAPPFAHVFSSETHIHVCLVYSCIYSDLEQCVLNFSMYHRREF